MPSTEKLPVPPKKLGFFQRVAERYRWTSLRNKIALWAFLAAIVIGAISLRWIQPAYRTTKMYFFLDMAQDAVARKDYNSASLAFRKALLSGMENPASWKALVAFLEEVRSPEVINVWERLASMEPEVPEHRYRQAEAALRHGRVFQAEEILRGFPETLKDTVPTLRIQAEIAARKTRLDEAEKALVRILELEPDNQKALFDLTSLRAESAEAGVRDAARTKLSEFAEGGGDFSVPALRRLIVLEHAGGNANEANRLAGKLIERPDITLADRLLHAKLEAATGSFTTALTLRNLRAHAATQLDDFGPIVEWLIASQLDPDGTARWIAELPSETTGDERTQPALFQYFLSTRDWERVFALLRDSASPLYVPPVVEQLAAEALEQDRAGLTVADQTWQRAVYAAEGKSSVLRVLSTLASARGWTSATGRALSALAEVSRMDSSVWRLLVEHEKRARNLPGLYKALDGLMRINPYDPDVSTDWVLAAALVRQGNKDEVLDEVLEVAKRTYESSNPPEVRAATAYALALHQLEREAEAMEVVDRMSLQDRQDPQRAIYVGAVLAANGRKDEALDYFRRSEEFYFDPFSEERSLRRIWKGVALGEATTAEEAERILIKQGDPDVRSKEINTALQTEILRRSDPAEVERIMQGIKAEAESRKKTPAEVQEMMRALRREAQP